MRDRIHDMQAWYKYGRLSPRTIKYKLKYRFILKMNKVHVKRFSDWDWTDRCDVVRHLPLVMLSDFIEHEHPFDRIVTDDPDHGKADWDELKAIYEWYKTYKEFDTWEYVESRIGKQDLSWENEPIEESGVDEWGDPKMYRMDFKPRTQQEEAVWREAYQKEAEAEEEFTRKACRVLELHRYLWT